MSRIPAFALVVIATLITSGCASFGAANGVFAPESATGGPAMVYAASDFNRGEIQRAATMAGIARCDQLLQLVASGQLPAGSVVNCQDAAGGFYSGPLNGWPGYYPTYGYGSGYPYGPTPSLLRDFQVTAEWQHQQAVLEDERRLEAAMAAGE